MRNANASTYDRWFEYVFTVTKFYTEFCGQRVVKSCYLTQCHLDLMTLSLKNS